MAFSEVLKNKVRRQAHFCCCLCHGIGVEVHHIVPLVEGGADVEDNAAPLCPSCHGTYGANPEKRKFIREVRDFWYELCTNRFSAPAEELKAIDAKLASVATKEDITRLAIQSSSFVLGANAPLPWEHLHYSFIREEFVHPLILRELLGLLSDPTTTIVSIDLGSANRSNRFFGDFSIRKENGCTWIEWRGGQRESFAYSHIATSPSGVQMLECHDWGGGSGVFGSVALVALECDRTLVETTDGISTRDRIILKMLGSIGLGDRYAGEISYQKGLLMIGPDEGWFKRGAETCREIAVR